MKFGDSAGFISTPDKKQPRFHSLAIPANELSNLSLLMAQPDPQKAQANGIVVEKSSEGSSEESDEEYKFPATTPSQVFPDTNTESSLQIIESSDEIKDKEILRLRKEVAY